MTRICDRPDPVPDEVWDQAARHYDEQELGTLVVAIAIANINVWNRLNVATRQVPARGGVVNPGVVETDRARRRSEGAP